MAGGRVRGSVNVTVKVNSFKDPVSVLIRADNLKTGFCATKSYMAAILKWLRCTPVPRCIVFILMHLEMDTG